MIDVYDMENFEEVTKEYVSYESNPAVIFACVDNFGDAGFYRIQLCSMTEEMNPGKTKVVLGGFLSEYNSDIAKVIESLKSINYDLKFRNFKKDIDQELFIFADNDVWNRN